MASSIPFRAAALSETGIHANVINPNERAVDDLPGHEAGAAANREVPVTFVTKNFEHVPDLF